MRNRYKRYGVTEGLRALIDITRFGVICARFLGYKRYACNTSVTPSTRLSVTRNVTLRDIPSCSLIITREGSYGNLQLRYVTRYTF